MIICKAIPTSLSHSHFYNNNNTPFIFSLDNLTWSWGLHACCGSASHGRHGAP